MKAIVLVAGKSERFWPLTEKALRVVAGKPLLVHQVDALHDSGFPDITLVGGKHNRAVIEAMLPEYSFIEQKDLALGMQGALLDVLPSIGDEPVMIVSSNDVVEPSAFEEMKKMCDKQPELDGLLLAKRVSHYFPGGYLTLDKNQIIGIKEKPGAGNEPSDLVNIVAHIHRHPKRLLDALKTVTSDRGDGYEQALDQLFASMNYEAMPYEGIWHPVKYPWHMLDLLDALLPNVPKPKIASPKLVHKTAVIEGSVIIEEGVKVLAHASIIGPAYIGKNSVIGNNALIRGSSVGEHSFIGYSTEVARSIVGNDVWTHSTYIGDSVIGNNVAFGAGCITANLRLDEGEISSMIKEESINTKRTKFGCAIGDNCRLGVRVTVSPGMKIGGGSFINSEANITQDIPDRSYATMKEGKLEIRENKQSVPMPEGREEFAKGAGFLH